MIFQYHSALVKTEVPLYYVCWKSTVRQIIASLYCHKYTAYECICPSFWIFYKYMSDYLAVMAVRGALIACSMDVVWPDWVPGLRKPETGRPAWERGLYEDSDIIIKSFVEVMVYLHVNVGIFTS